jgi:hypothetical protein
LDEELKRLAAGERPVSEGLATEVAALPLVVGADGISVPFRPHDKHPGEAVVWREVKVGMLARFCHRVQKNGKHVFYLLG